MTSGDMPAAEASPLSLGDVSSPSHRARNALTEKTRSSLKRHRIRRLPRCARAREWEAQRRKAAARDTPRERLLRRNLG